MSVCFLPVLVLFSSGPRLLALSPALVAQCQGCSLLHSRLCALWQLSQCYTCFLVFSAPLPSSHFISSKSPTFLAPLHGRQF